ncbi:MAG: C40 family peptidase [Lachnospiraceae bacterium]|nr:C40 family peptidase [Lachnospiraceae bacterium]
MKKLLGIGLCIFAFVVMIMGVMIAGIGGGGIGSIASPLVVFATEEEAYGYQYIGSELGVPWDIILLADGMHAYENEAENLAGYNPMMTSLQFCILMEEEKVPGEETVSGGDAGESWETQTMVYYVGREKILEYMGITADELTYREAAGVITAINAVAEEKSTEELKYEATLLVNPDYENVLRDFIGLSEENTTFAMEVFHTHYLAEMYGYVVDYSYIELPDIVQGDVTRHELALVATSLIGHPYLMGGKSGQTGPPTGPLDCSGYVDWVYVQCFGSVVSSGQLPQGVAVSGTAMQWYASEAITEDELKVGDLGFLYDPATMSSGQVNHVGIYIGTDSNGNNYWIHCAGRRYGTTASPSGRVGISLPSVTNSYNPVDGSSFEPMMPACRFRYFRRPRFSFSGE